MCQERDGVRERRRRQAVWAASAGRTRSSGIPAMTITRFHYHRLNSVREKHPGTLGPREGPRGLVMTVEDFRVIGWEGWGLKEMGLRPVADLARNVQVAKISRGPFAMEIFLKGYLVGDYHSTFK